MAFAGVAFRFGKQPVIFDSYAYFTHGRQIASEGLFRFASPVRSYGYPLFVAACSRVGDALRAVVSTDPDVLLRRLVFVAQLAIFLAACAFAARRLAPHLPGPRSRTLLYAFAALNPFLLIAATEVLTDLLSAVLVFLAVVLLLPPPDGGRGRWSAPLLSMAAAGAATAVRPANVVMLAACAFLWFTRAYRRRDVKAPLLAAAIVAGLVPLIPQSINNSRAFGEPTPLIVEHLYAKQLDWGTVALKYATLVVPGRAPQVLYRNPLRPPDVFTAREFVRRRPAGYALTLLLHGFALLDQDYPFTYIVDPRPWYRWPLSIVQYAYLFLAATGFLAVTRSLSARRRCLRFPVFVFVVAIASYTSIHLPIAVECRFSLPLLLLLVPAAAWGTASLRGLADARERGSLLLLGVSAILFVGACAALSAWIARQAL